MSALQDGTFSIAAVNGPARRVFPFQRDRLTFYTEQRWMQLEANYVALPLNSPSASNPTLLLVEERDFENRGAGVLEWTRVYARVPQTRSEYETFSYTFPGYAATVSEKLATPWALPSGTFVSADDPGRIPFTQVVTSRMQFDYFLVGSGGQYETAASIPLTAAQRYVYGSGFGANAGGDLPDRLLMQATVPGYGVNGADVTNLTSPTIEAWKALIAAGTEIVAEQSALRPWMGNIYERATRYVKAL